MQQSCSKTADVYFNRNDAFTVELSQSSSNSWHVRQNMPTGINTCNNKDYDLTEVLNSQRQCVP